MPRLVVLSDTHLSPTIGLFYKNFTVVRDRINADPPDLIVNGGDMCVNGADWDDDRSFARECHRRLRAPVKFIPGNHDIGETPAESDSHQPVTPARIAQYRSDFGSNWWAEDLGAWRLIGLDALLMGAGIAEEAAQWDWAAQAFEAAGERPIGLFVHKPLFVDTPDDPPEPLAAIVPEARARLLELARGRALRFVVSGHLHQSKTRLFDGVTHIWAPSTAFSASQPQDEADNRPGYAVFDLTDTDFSVRFEFPPDLSFYDIAEIKGHGKYAYLRDMPPCPPDLEA